MWNEPFNSWAVQKHSKARASHWKLEVFLFLWDFMVVCSAGLSAAQPTVKALSSGRETMTHPWWEIPHIYNVVLILLLSPPIDKETGQANNEHQDRRVTRRPQWLRNSPHVNPSTSHCLVLNDLWVGVCVCNRERFPHHSIFWPDENWALERITYWKELLRECLSQM